MSKESLSKRYLNAYVACFSDQDQSSALKNLIDVLDAFISNYEFFKLLMNPVIGNDKKYDLINQFINEKNIFLRSFFHILIQKKRIELLRVMSKEAVYLLDSIDGTLNAKVFSSTQIKNEEKNFLKSFLSNYFKKDINIDVVVDESILAGFRIEVANMEFDSTLDNSLKKLKLAFK